MDLAQARKQIEEAIQAKEMLLVIGNCFVEYWGRAASKLPKGKRLCLIKGDNSFGIHQNRKLRPVNYMMNARIAVEEIDGALLLSARKQNPKEEIKAYFYRVDGLHRYEMDDPNDLRLFGSERELSDELMKDLTFLEPGLRPLKSEVPMRKGTVDIMAEDAEGRLVVVEVKRRKADFQSVTQLERYMKQVSKLKNSKARGILVAPDIGRNALELLEQSGLEFLKFDFEIGNPKATIRGVTKKQPTLAEYVKK